MNDEYLPRLELVLVFGREAATFITGEFNPKKGYRLKGYECIVLPHFSKTAAKYHRIYEDEIEYAKERVKEVLGK